MFIVDSQSAERFETRGPADRTVPEARVENEERPSLLHAGAGLRQSPACVRSLNDHRSVGNRCHHVVPLRKKARVRQTRLVCVAIEGNVAKKKMIGSNARLECAILARIALVDRGSDDADDISPGGQGAF